jgi:hypothetical protein
MKIRQKLGFSFPGLKSVLIPGCTPLETICIGQSRSEVEVSRTEAEVRIWAYIAMVQHSPVIVHDLEDELNVLNVL